MIIDSINTVHSNDFIGCHGRYHTMYVVDTVEYILLSLFYDARTIELGKIVALLHDIGTIAGRKNHAQKSAALASVLLDETTRVLPKERDFIINAIYDHSEGKNISSALGAALLIADKTDISKKRLLPDKTLDDWHKNIMEIENVDINISGKVISIYYLTTDKFSEKIFASESAKFHSIPKRAAIFLDCACHFQINDEEKMVVL